MSRLSSALLAALLFSLAADGTAAGDDQSKEKKQSAEEPVREKLEAPVETVHSIRVDGKEIRYKATAGFLVLKKESDDDEAQKKDEPSDARADDGLKPKAKFFFVAYTLEGASAADRPITFAFNGGPGSSSVWLHLGALGPRRVIIGPDGGSTPPPYRLADNPHTWLDETDLVFIDPVSTGYSRPARGEKASSFHRYREDIESVGEFIRSYTTRSQRWLSPKLVAGESYGGTRAAALAEYLQSRDGIYLSGAILVSPALNFVSFDFSPGNDIAFMAFLPAYTAAAWYHKRLSAELLGKPIEEVLEASKAFAGASYLAALAKGAGISASEKQDVADTLSSLTGLSSESFMQQNLRIPGWQFARRLLEKQDLILGRFDSRITGFRTHPGSDQDDYDPSYDAVLGPFTAAINAYLRGELKFETDLPYAVLAALDWKFDTSENRYLSVTEDLRSAMTRNPYLKTWVSCGCYDLAIPFFGTAYSVNQLMLNPVLSKNLRFTQYQAGHMFYTVDTELAKFKTDFKTFLKSAVVQQPIDDTRR